MKLIDRNTRVNGIVEFWLSDIPDLKTKESVILYARTDVIELADALRRANKEIEELITKLQRFVGTTGDVS